MLGIYITAGYPSEASTLEALKILDQAQVDLIELGVPFSDPLADGPVIQAASHQALENGMNLDKIFDLVNQAKLSTKTILFSYYNPLAAYGFDKVIEKSKAAGISGALIPDLPVNEAEELSQQFKAAGLDLVLLAAITSTDERLEKIAKLSEPFIYLVSRTGVTGADTTSLRAQRSNPATKIPTIIEKLKSYSNKPVALGFGIDSKEKVEAAYQAGADMAIIGTKAVKLSENLDEFKKFIDVIASEAKQSSQPNAML